MTKTARNTASQVLTRFGVQVDAFMAGKGAGDKVAKYTSAVQRAASDLGNRKTRSEVVESLLKGIW
ncbi:MAG: hypothetical protein KBH14_00280 [Vicinamibacteria bacterium]|nr:hypothetical protein [Vicinamibacteria bacterium]